MLQAIPIDQKEILQRYQPIDKYTHKGIQGHALLIGGSYGKIGAVSLSSKACLKTGCGLVTAFIPLCGYNILQTTIPEVMVLTDRSEKCISKIEFDFVPQAIGIGHGIGNQAIPHPSRVKNPEIDNFRHARRVIIGPRLTGNHSQYHKKPSHSLQIHLHFPHSPIF